MSAPTDGDAGWYPDNWISPVIDPDLPWVTPADDDRPDPVPPENRLAEEPAWEGIRTADRGQNDAVASILRGFLPPEADDDFVPEGARRFVQPGFAGLDLRDYSKLPSGKGWGAPCAAARATVTLTHARVTVDARIAELVGLVLRACEARGYIFRAADTGAYNCRKIAGTNTWSNHAWALAIDVNWQSNPYTSAWVTDIPDWMHNLLNRYGFAWGGDYTGGKRDFMHFEFMGTPQQAQLALALARAELGAGSVIVTPSPTPVVPTGTWPLAPGGFPYSHDHCFGLITDPSAKVHGGINATERRYIIWIQQGLIATGCVGGIGDWRSSWADGRYEGATVQAMALYQRRFEPRTTLFGQCWWDDYRDLQLR